MLQDKIIECLQNVSKNTPLVHNITNYVTVNDCANCILAIGGSPIMADDLEEVAQITALSKSLVINIGTLNKRTIDSMLVSGKKANELGIPVVFDPVGAGASPFRNETTKKIIDQVPLSIIRGNLSEISYIAGVASNTKGVDASLEDKDLDSVEIAKQVAKKLGCIVVITGSVDVISDGERVTKVRNGHPLMAKVTGTGCMTTAITGAFQGGTKDSYVAAVTGIVVMGIAGELAFLKYGKKGTGSFHIGIIDELSMMNENTLKERIKIEEL